MSKVFEPGWGNASLRTIIETEIPEPISLIPVTPGWWLLLLALVGLLLRTLWHRRQRYLRDQYRRDALVQLLSIKKRVGAGTLEAARELAPLLRATAMAAAGRETLAGLQGDAYAEALAELAPGQGRLPVDDLQQLAYAPLRGTDTANIEEFIVVLEKWIEQHRGIYA